MMGKIVALGAMGVGYVLGARAGRERYEQIRTQAERLWSNPKVQRTVSQAGDAAKEKAPLIKEKSAEAAHKATDKVSDAVRSSGNEDAATVDPVTGFRNPGKSSS